MLLKEFVEVESGAKTNRSQLNEALAMCRLYGAKLVIAKLDRLSRDAHFLLGLEKAGVDFVAADMPNANRFTVGILALVAEQERQLISERTKAALAAAKERGVKLGGTRPNGLNAHCRQKSAAVLKQRADARASDIMPAIKALQKDSALAEWYRQRTQAAPATRKTLIVALARKLLIALWRLAHDGIVPEGVQMRPA